MSLAMRIGKLEGAMGLGGGPRQVIVWYSPDFAESWIERGGERLNFYVRTPSFDDDPREHLTPAMRREIRPNDQVIAYEAMGKDRRNPHLQMDVPPWKRRPWRMVDDGKAYELEGEDAVWRRHEFR